MIRRHGNLPEAALPLVSRKSQCCVALHATRRVLPHGARPAALQGPWTFDNHQFDKHLDQGTSWP